MNDPILNKESALQLYAVFLGDVTRTAAALGVRPCDVLRIAEEEGWDAKLAPILELKKSTAPGDVERAINRALNFTQARRACMLLEKTLNKLCGMNEGELEQYLFFGEPDKLGNQTKKLTTRALADLASAIEKVQSLTYMALGDTAQDRSRRKDDGTKEVSGSDMHRAIADAMAKTRGINTPRSQLFEMQLDKAESLRLEVLKDEIKPNPNDNDDH